jgi:hypothetical protein
MVIGWMLSRTNTRHNKTYIWRYSPSTTLAYRNSTVLNVSHGIVCRVYFGGLYRSKGRTAQMPRQLPGKRRMQEARPRTYNQGKGARDGTAWTQSSVLKPKTSMADTLDAQVGSIPSSP